MNTIYILEDNIKMSIVCASFDYEKVKEIKEEAENKIVSFNAMCDEGKNLLVEVRKRMRQNVCIKKNVYREDLYYDKMINLFAKRLTPEEKKCWHLRHKQHAYCSYKITTTDVV